MSVVSTTSNYGGRIGDYSQNIKQFYISANSYAQWVFAKLSNGLKVQIPINKIIPVCIPSDLYIFGNIYNFNPSDLKLKTNIKDISREKVDKLFNEVEAKEFAYKSNPNEQHFGFIAQDIEGSIPELVKTENINNISTKHIFTMEIIPFLFAKIKSLDSKIINLQNEIELLKNNNIDLQNDNNKLNYFLNLILTKCREDDDSDGEIEEYNCPLNFDEISDTISDTISNSDSSNNEYNQENLIQIDSLN